MQGERGMAEGAGFEPAGVAPNGFQDRRLKPLGHPSWAAIICLAIATIDDADVIHPRFSPDGRTLA